jgi:hypothetical protein
MRILYNFEDEEKASTLSIIKIASCIYIMVGGAT